MKRLGLIVLAVLLVSALSASAWPWSNWFKKNAEPAQDEGAKIEQAADKAGCEAKKAEKKAADKAGCEAKKAEKKAEKDAKKAEKKVKKEGKKSEKKAKKAGQKAEQTVEAAVEAAPAEAAPAAE